MKIRLRATLTTVLLAGSVVAALSGQALAAGSSTGVTAKTIKIGFITSETGVASSSFSDSAQGIQARFDWQNAHGGVDGRKLELVTADDQSSPAQFTTAAQDLVTNKGVFAVVPFSSFTFSGAHYLQQQGVPVVGDAFDGYEWYQQPYSNMFNFAFAVAAEQNNTFYTNSYLGSMLKAAGVTKLGVLAYGISPSSQASVKAAEAAAKAQGIGICYENLSVPFGGVDFTADVLQIKSAGCNGILGSFVDASDIALSGALKQAGYTGKQLYYTGYDQEVLDSASARTAMQGDYFTASAWFGQPNAALKTMISALKKYAPAYTGGLPDFGLYGSYVAADLLVKGLQLAGKNPTQQSFTTALRKVTSYDGNGLLPSPTTFAHFGTPSMFPKSVCSFLVQLKGSAYNLAGKPGGRFCGKTISF